MVYHHHSCCVDLLLTDPFALRFLHGGRESIRGVESIQIVVHRYEPVAETCRERLTAAISDRRSFQRIKEKVPVELVEEGVEEDEGPAALASHPMTTEGSSHEEEAADCRQ